MELSLYTCICNSPTLHTQSYLEEGVSSVQLEHDAANAPHVTRVTPAKLYTHTHSKQNQLLNPHTVHDTTPRWRVVDDYRC